MDTFNDDVVISGIGCYLPKSVNVQEFKDRLYANESLVEPKWPEGEKGVCNISGGVPYQKFDNAYFGIHRLQCTFMDPMHRIVLERTFEALLDAGVNPTEVRGKRIGVYMGSTIGENDNLFLESVVSGFGVTGHSRAMMPNRVSYWLNLKGPSVAYDCNWVSGFEVMRLAYNSIRSGQCESVLIGSANLAMHSEFQWIYNDMGLLSPDGTTKAFDVNANGYARSDGFVVMYLQKASQARRSYASIVHIATRYDGTNDEPILVHNVDKMVEFMDDFYKKCPVKPEEIDYVETYGCALKEIDKKELDALERVYCKDRKTPLMIGSVKTLTGHCEASAALVSLVSVLIAMENGKLPATIQHQTPNPEIRGLNNGSMQVLTTNTPWTSQYAAVNAIGMNTYYGHVVVKANVKPKIPIKMDIPMLLNVSTRTEEGIKEIIEVLKNKPKDPEFYRLVQEVFSKPIQGHLYRGYTVLGKEAKDETVYHMGNKRQIWFVYSGMGSQWNGMVSDLMQFEIFAKSIQRSHETLSKRGVDLMHIITSDDKSMFDNILHCFVGIAAIQIALTDLLKAIGIVPDGIIGHSVGELGCAYADGCMTPEQMILSSYSRGRASIESELIRGMMAAVGLGYNQIKHKVPEPIEVACHNGPESCTISGPVADMEVFVKQLQDEGVFARLVNVANIAYHSRYIKPAAPTLLKYLKDVLPEPIARSSKWVSTSNIESKWDTELAKHSSAEYHTNNLLSSVLFEEGCKHIPKDSILIEIAPHGLLQAILKRSVPNTINVPLTNRSSKSGVEFFVQSLGKLYNAGLDFDISKIYPQIEYPVSRGTPTLTDLAKWNHSETWKYFDEDDKLHAMMGNKEYEVTLNSDEFRDCVGHQLKDNIVLPLSRYLDILFQIFGSITATNTDVVFESLHFKRHLVIPRSGMVHLHAMVQKGSGEFEVVSNKYVLVTGKIVFPQDDDDFLLEPETVTIGDEYVELSSTDFYNEMQHRGCKYTGPYKSLKSLKLVEDGSVSTVQWNNSWPMLLEAMFQQQLLMAGERNQNVHIPRFIQKIAICQTKLPTEKTTLQVDFDYSTKMLSTPGVQILGIETSELEIEESHVYLDTVESISLTGATFDTFEGGLDFVLRLVLHNFYDPDVKTLFITEINTENSLQDYIKNVIRDLSQINCNVTSVSEPKQIVTQQSYPQLIVVNDVPDAVLFKLISYSGAYLLSKTDKNVNEKDIVEVAQIKMRNISYSIFRKANNAPVTRVIIKGDTLSIKDLKRSSVSWVNDLNSAVEEAKVKNNSVYLISSLVPLEGINNFVQELRSQPEMKQVRFLFNLDKSDGNHDQIFKRDLIISVIKNQSLVTCIALSFKHKDNIILNNTSSNVIQNKTIAYLGMNLKDETINPAIPKKNDIGNIDYTAVTNSGERVMGIASLDKDSTKLVLDPIFQWEIPSMWSLQDGATVPHAYISAYYMLMIKGNLKPGQTVLIHAACSPVGLAAASIAGSHGCEVFLTVSTYSQRAYLKEQFAFIRDYNILSSDDDSFETDLKIATNGKGAHVILNCVSGSLLRHSLACIGDYGNFIQYGKYDVEEGNSIGMYCFLRNTSFYVVNLENVLIQHREIKEQIKKYIEEGIDNMTVRPLALEVATNFDVPKILSQIKNSTNIGKVIIKLDNSLNLSKLNVDKPDKFICNPKNSYLVYGGTPDNGADVTEWLVLRGAKKIVISSDLKPQQNNHINRRLSLLQSYFDASIIIAPNKAHTKEGAAELLSEVAIMGPIHAVFILPSKTNGNKASDIKPIQYIDNVLRTTLPKAIFLNFVNGAAGICNARADAGFNTYNIQWPKDENISDTFFALDSILSSNTNNVLVKKEKIGETKHDGGQIIFKDLRRLLPTTDDILRDQKHAPEEPEFIQVITEGPVEIRELAPLFLIPGLTGRAELDELVKTLLYPTFLARYPSKAWPIEKLAKCLVKKMQAIYPKKVYNIVSVSTGGALAIEIARILHKQNASLTFFFIDSAPSVVQHGFKQLGESGHVLEVSMLRIIFDINDTEILDQLKAAPDWEARVNMSMKFYEGTEFRRKQLETGLLALNDRVNYIVNYKPTDLLVSGKVFLIRPGDMDKFDNCQLNLYCEKQPQTILATGDHLSIIRTVETSEYINKNVSLK